MILVSAHNTFVVRMPQCQLPRVTTARRLQPVHVPVHSTGWIMFQVINKQWGQARQTHYQRQQCCSSGLGLTQEHGWWYNAIIAKVCFLIRGSLTIFVSSYHQTESNSTSSSASSSDGAGLIPSLDWTSDSISVTEASIMFGTPSADWFGVHFKVYKIIG